MNRLFRATFLRATLLFAPWAFPAIVRGDEPRPHPIAITTGDGAILSARYFAGNLGAKSPAVILIDDIADEARPSVCDDLARLLLRQGCAVLCFDFRGCGRSRSVESEFWDHPTNRQLVKGFKAEEPPEKIRFADFKPKYLPALVNDVAAARAYLERRNDAGECNIGQTYLIGFGRGATLGQLWLASEWFRFRVSGSKNRVSTKPEGRDIAGCIWVGLQFALDRPVPMLDLMRKSEAKKSTLVWLIHDSDDFEGSRFAKQCTDAFNPNDRETLVASHSMPHESKMLAERDGMIAQIGKYLDGLRKNQDQPLWENRNFDGRRYVWAVKGTPNVSAKDDGDDFFQPVPVDKLLEKR